MERIGIKTAPKEPSKAVSDGHNAPISEIGAKEKEEIVKGKKEKQELIKDK